MMRSTRAPFLFAALVLGWAALASAQSDGADIPSKQLSLAGDPNLSYFLIGPVAKQTPPEGFGLIVVLPGGDGKADSLAYYIEHSPQDKICPLAMAQEAVRRLIAEGAKVQFNQYAGGHGWRGNIYPRISAAVQWLEKNAQPRRVAGDK